jgi:hypothetical protein
MINPKIVKYASFLLLIAAVIYGCSKDNEDVNTSNKGLKSDASGDKIFTGDMHGNQFANGKINQMLANFNAQYNFSDNTGNNIFTGSTPGTGGGGGGVVPIGSGSFTVDGQSFPLYAGAYEGWGDGWFGLCLIDQIPENWNDELIDFNALYFEMISNSNNEISNGTYLMSQSEYPFTFYYAGVGFNINTDNEHALEFVQGELIFSGIGNNYNITFTGILEDSRIISGSYSGQLVDLDDEPEPPASTMSAYINSNYWSTEYPYAYMDYSYGILSIYGASSAGNESINLILNSAMISSGAQLTWENGGVSSALYTLDNNYFYVYYSANVYISAYTGSSISGTFEFYAEDYYGNPANVTSGNFTNISISQ